MLSPPLDKASRAEREEADSGDYEDSDNEGSEEGGYSGSASRLQLVLGLVARLEAQLADVPQADGDATQAPEEIADEEPPDDDLEGMPANNGR